MVEAIDEERDIQRTFELGYLALVSPGIMLFNSNVPLHSLLPVERASSPTLSRHSVRQRQKARSKLSATLMVHAVQALYT